MAVFLERFNLSYFAVPKVACTSVKAFFFAVENGYELGPFCVNGARYKADDILHRLYPTRDFNKIDHHYISHHRKFAIVREPIERFISCYLNRVIECNDLAESVLEFHKLKDACPPRPTFAQFLEFLPIYRSIPNIRHHTASQTVFLGNDTDYFDQIFSLGAIDDFVARINNLTDSNRTLPHLKSSDKRSALNVSDAEKRVIQEYYREDYDVFGNWFQ